MRYNFDMPMTAHDILEAANRLSRADRSWLAHELLHPPGDGSTDAEIDAAWRDEVERRIDQIESGSEEAVPWETVQRELDSMRSQLKSKA